METTRQLRQAVLDCSQRGLYESARWAAEQLNGLIDTQNELGSQDEEPPHAFSVTSGELNKYLLGITSFHMRDYNMAAFHLETCKESLPVFLKLYSKYLLVDREFRSREIQSKQHEKEKDKNNETPTQKSSTDLKNVYSELANLKRTLDSYCNPIDQADPFLLFLLSIVCKKLSLVEQSQELIIASIRKYPMNWSAWLELASFVKSPEQVNNLMSSLPSGIFKRSFYVIAGRALMFPARDLLVEIASLEPTLSSPFLQVQKAMLYFDNRDYHSSARLFEEITKKCPFVMDGMDEYANVLYVLGDRSKLCSIAQKCTAADKYNPITCTVVGNYFSIRLEHEKAISYFRLATELNRNASLPWTLIGHEYLELNNQPAAIEAYRRAIDINEKDFRAWYGLGNIYHLTGMPLYALHYFQKAVVLRPNDGRFWTALGDSYEQIDRIQDAIKCYKRSLVGLQVECITESLMKLAQLHRKLGDERAMEVAFHYFKLAFAEFQERNQVTSPDASEAAIFVSQMCMRKGRFAEAEKYVEFVVHTDHGRALMREIRSATR
ncbi:Anaphase-promoting complex subunit 23 [Blyttiomyces sp. JEL0837]|nr:Anaphase-promoting complex subunit 23 [Blyttiomyces sp. JEL0837]